MTLCLSWKKDGVVHFASDSRLAISGNSYADVAIKVLAIPYRIYSPYDNSNNRKIDYSGELGMCFAGSAVTSLFVKESITDLVKDLQYAPGYTEKSMRGIANFVFEVYRVISKEVCKTAIGKNGTASIILAGKCPEEGIVRAFSLTTDKKNNYSLNEILTGGNNYYAVGSGKQKADALIPDNPTNMDYLKVLKTVIDDKNLEAVGGNIQYGKFQDAIFRTYGISEFNGEGHYWRGVLDLNSEEFISGPGNFIPSYKFIDL